MSFTMLSRDTEALHKRAREFENREDRSDENEHYRETPLMCPTLALTCKCSHNAGRTSIDRYIAATGFPMPQVIKYDEPEKMKVYYDTYVQWVPVDYFVELPVKQPNANASREDFAYLLVGVFDSDEKKREYPIKIGEAADELAYTFNFYLGGVARDQQTIRYPLVDVPCSGHTFDLFPYPSDGYDEGFTKTYNHARAHSPRLSFDKLWAKLHEGICKIEYLSGGRSDGHGSRSEIVSLYCTRFQPFMPPNRRFLMHGDPEFEALLPEDEQQEEGAGKKADNDKGPLLKVFDTERYEWAAVRYEKIRAVRIRELPYPMGTQEPDMHWRLPRWTWGPLRDPEPWESLKGVPIHEPARRQQQEDQQEQQQGAPVLGAVATAGGA